MLSISQGNQDPTKYFFLFHLLLHVVDLLWICLNRQKLDNESPAILTSKITKFTVFMRSVGESGGGVGDGIELKFWTLEGGGEGGYQKWTSANKGEEGSKFWAVCDNVIIECSLRILFSFSRTCCLLFIEMID